MLKYSGKITMDEHYTRLLDISKSLIELLEKFYSKNMIYESFSIQVTDKQIVEELKKADSDAIKNKILYKYKLFYPNYEKKCFNRLLCDFCQYMYESLRCIFEFKPQIAYTLARKPLIDDIFYLQYLLVNAEKAIDLIFSEDPKEKDVLKQKELDKQISDKIVRDLGYRENIYHELRYEDAHYGILHNCNKAMHISISRSKSEVTASGELNFIFMEDKEIEYYTKLYLDTVPILLFYVAIIIKQISEKINGKDQSLDETLEKLQNEFAEVMEKKNTTGENNNG